MTTSKVYTNDELEKILSDLAHVSVIAFSLKQELSPLSQEDIQMGAEPLTQGQIQSSLDEIQTRIAKLALFELKATNEQWYAANDTVQ